MSLKESSSNLIDSKDLMWIWRSIIHRWPIYIFSILISLGIGYLYNYKKIEIYNSKIEILLNSNEVYNYQEGLKTNLGYYNFFADIANQKRIIKSFDLVRKTVDKLNLDVSYYIQGRINKKEIFQNLPFKIETSFISPSVLEKEIDFKILDSKSYEIILNINGVDTSFKHFFDSSSTNKYYSLKTTLISKDSDFVSENLKIIDYRITFHQKKYWINRIINSTNVENIEFTSMLLLQNSDEIPFRSRMVLDTLANEFIKNTLANEFKINDNTLVYINKQLIDVVDILDSIQFEIENLKNRKDIININKESDLYFSELIKSQSLEKTLGLKISTLNNLSKYLSDFSDDKIVPPSLYILKEDEYLNKSIDEYYKSKIKYLDQSFGFKNEHLSLEKLRNEIDNRRTDLIIYIKNLINAFEIEKTEKRSDIKHFKRMAKKSPFSKNDISSIERKLMVNEKIYTYLLEKRANTIISKSGILPKTKVIEKARTIGLVSGRSIKYVIYFGIFGFIFTFILIVIYRIFIEKISSTKELGETTFLPVIGGIPFLKDQDFTTTSLKSKGDFIESLRAIRTSTNFLLSNNKNNFKSFLVTSIHPGEGKTFTTISLARIFAASGKKVLVVDFDLHKPKVHKVLNFENDYGNSSILSTEKNTINKSIHNMEENLDVITSGPVPPNPSELVLSSRVKDLLNFANANYDYIFLDTPPIGIITDALVLSSIVDHSFFVMNSKIANKKGLRFIEEINEKSKIKSQALILNGIKNNKWRRLYSYGNYGYSYGYGYGYGYGNSYGYKENS